MTQKADIWFAIDVTCHSPMAEAVEFAFNELCSLGTEIGFYRPGDKVLTIKGYFETEPQVADVKVGLKDALRIYGFIDHVEADSVINSLHLHKVERTDWLAEWKRHWRPTEIANFVIAPPWNSELRDADKIVIKIEPNMAFGTGTHETTKLCLRAISTYFTPEMSFLDVGTGTGILAIAAAKLGGRDIAAVEIDEDAVEIARGNAVLNDVGENIVFAGGSVDKSTPAFDMVCANLTIDTILPMLDMLLEKSRGLLVLSGILTEQQPIILLALRECRVTNAKVEVDGEWIAVIVDRR